MSPEKDKIKKQSPSELQGNPKSRQYQGQLNNVQYADTDKSVNLGYIP